MTRQTDNTVQRPRLRHLIGTGFLATLLFGGCGHRDTAEDVTSLARAGTPNTAMSPRPLSDESPTQEAVPDGHPVVHEGTILEVIDVRHYSLIRFEPPQNDEKWAALYQGQFQVGQHVTIAESILMKDFHSPSLNRTFPEIIFGSVVTLDGKAAETVQAPREPDRESPSNGTQKNPVE